MKQIYRFNGIQPPAVSEKTLQAEIERRKEQRQIVLLVMAGILAGLCLLITAIVLQPINIILSMICIAYACVSMSGGGVIAIVFAHKRRNFTW
ncbi:MAG TPA: hypothetical protein VN441_13410 [Syntrophomonas sp.]|nr:hypothetical protein [Syntrophomonas sp.]